jgi:hypothetical protein
VVAGAGLSLVSAAVAAALAGGRKRVG